MWSNSKYSPIKKRIEVSLAARRPPGLEAVVSLLHTLFQQDLQQVIKSKYSFERVSLVRNSAAPSVGFEKAGSVDLHYVLQGKLTL